MEVTAVPEKVLELHNVSAGYKEGKKVKQILKDVSFTLYEGEIVGLVGASGSGKTTLCKCILGLLKDYEGQVIHYANSPQMVFQDPYGSLNPKKTIGWILEEPLKVRGGFSGQERRKQAEEMLEQVHLQKDFYGRYPRELSGGQRQRVGIARALVLQPDLIICDEPISALDVSIQAQVINLLKDYQDEKGISYLFIAHDLSMVRYVSDEVGVMYLGQLVEVCESNEIYKNPLHPYTKGLLGSIPIANPRLARQKVKSSIEGDIPSPIHPPEGCRFHTRCPYARPECSMEKPQMKDVGGGHLVACHLYG